VGGKSDMDEGIAKNDKVLFLFCFGWRIIPLICVEFRDGFMIDISITRRK
jgi:hypothetical protein